MFILASLNRAVSSSPQLGLVGASKSPGREMVSDAPCPRSPPPPQIHSGIVDGSVGLGECKLLLCPFRLSARVVSGSPG